MPLPRERLRTARDVADESVELRQLREGFSLTQQQMAHLLDVSPATYYRWETGKFVIPLMALELMRAWAREEDQQKRAARAARRK